MRLPALIVALCACHPSATTSSSAQALVECAPVTAFGAVPNDGLDDAAAIQASLDLGCLNLRDAPGRYEIDVPPLNQRALWVLRSPAGTRFYGAGPSSVLAWRGSAGGDDVWGVRIDSQTVIEDIHFDGDGLSNTNEHAPLIFWVGPVDDVVARRLSFNYPVRAGQKRGDCIQGVGYAPDMLSTNITIERNNFDSCGRAAFAYHSGTRGLTYKHNHHRCVSDGELDGEGRGNEPHLLLDGAEIAYNVFDTCADQEGGNSIQLVRAANVNMHHNDLNGRGVDLAEVSGVLHHNKIVMLINDEGLPNVQIRKGSTGLRLHNERYTRVATGGNVIMIENNGIAPHDIRIEDSRLVQHASWQAIRIAGSYDVTLSDLEIVGLGAIARAAVLLEGIRAPVYDVRVFDGDFTGNLSSAVEISGAYQGAGAVTVERTSAPAPVRCTDAGGITAPVQLADNVMPAPVGCP